ncbi:MAG: S9 family peptidase, partial [Proteobacteria bacterium]
EEYFAVFGKTSSELFVVTNKFSDFKRLYLYKEGKFTPVSPEVSRDIEGLNVSGNHKRMFVQWNDGGYAKTQAFDPYTLKFSDIPYLPKSAQQSYVGSVSRMGRYASVGIETGLEPRTSYVLDIGTGKLTQWVRPSLPEIDSKNFVPQTLEFYPAADGTKIPMLVTRPVACAKQVCPVVVDFHGGPEGQSRPGFDRVAQLYAAHGFIYVEPNVRGSEGYGRKWMSADDGAKRLKVITDIEDAAKFIRKEWAKNGVEPKVGVTGGSYGGYSTLVAMTKFAGAYDAGVSNVGMSNLRSFLLNTAPYRRILRISEYGDPEKDREALEQLSPITYIDQVKAPFMIIQGASDPRVPVGEALQMRSALAARGIQAPLIIFADEGHGSAKRDNKVIQIGAGLEFFEQHLK